MNAHRRVPKRREFQLGDGYFVWDWDVLDLVEVSMNAWGIWLSQGNRTICRSVTPIGELSTVCLGMPHAGGIFETIFFTDPAVVSERRRGVEDASVHCEVGRQETFARACAQHRRSLRAIERVLAQVNGDTAAFAAARQLGYDQPDWPSWLKERNW